MIVISNRFRTFAVALTATFAAVALSASAANAAAKIQRYMSPGGIEAWFVQDATVPVIAMEYSFDGGASQDPADKTGVGYLVAAMLNEGAGDLDSKTYQDRLERRAISLSWSAARDHFRGSLRTLKENGGEAFGLLKLALTAPRFDSEPLERERAQVISGLRRETSNPNSLAGRRFFEALFGNHPYGRPSNGTLESVPTITSADLKTYAGRVFARDTLKVSVVGDIEPAALGKLLDMTFGTLPAKGDLVVIPKVEAAKPPQRSLIALDVPQTVVMFGGPGIHRDDPDFMAAFVANHILGGGSSSRLYREIREKRGLAYSVYEQLLWMKQSAIFTGATATRADRANETVDTITTEARRMADEGPTQQELNDAKSYLKGSQMLALDTNSKIASALLLFQIDKLGIDYIEKRNALVDAVTLEDVKRVSRRLWGNGLLTVIVGRSA